MSIYDEANAAFAEIHGTGILGDSCSIANTNVNAVFNAERKEFRFDGQSQREVTIRQAVVLKSAYANRPADRAAVVKAGVTYYVTEVSEDNCQWIVTMAKRY